MGSQSKSKAMSQASSKCKLKATLIRNEKEASKVAAIVEALERDRVSCTVGLSGLTAGLPVAAASCRAFTFYHVNTCRID